MGWPVSLRKYASSVGRGLHGFVSIERLLCIARHIPLPACRDRAGYFRQYLHHIAIVTVSLVFALHVATQV